MRTENIQKSEIKFRLTQNDLEKLVGLTPESSEGKVSIQYLNLYRNKDYYNLFLGNKKVGLEIWGIGCGNPHRDEDYSEYNNQIAILSSGDKSLLQNAYSQLKSILEEVK
ncbi:MAG: hypothetical protein PVJ67_01755 [Candidatus Pacearchaeota archaeon]|jgi:hypothetical protein